MKVIVFSLIILAGIIALPVASAIFLDSETAYFVDYEFNHYVWNPNNQNYSGSTTINVTDIGNFDTVEFIDLASPIDVNFNDHEILYNRQASVSSALPVLLYLDQTVIELEEENKTQNEIIKALEKKAGLQGKKIKNLQSQILDMQSQLRSCRNKSNHLVKPLNQCLNQTS